MDWNALKFKTLRYVTNVRDGDTIEVSGLRAIRWPGQNTPEKTMPYGMEARARLVELLGSAGNLVLCVAFDEGGSLSGDRVRWHPLYENPNRAGQWVNAAVILGREGLTIPFPQKEEWSFNKEINAACLEAMASKVGLWSQPSETLRVAATFNPLGGDAGEEYIDVTNHRKTPRDIGGCSVRLSDAWGPDQRGFIFPDGASIPANGSVRVRLRPGKHTSREFFWDYGGGTLTLPMNNPDPVTGNGDVVIFLRRNGIPAAWDTWLPS